MPASLRKRVSLGALRASFAGLEYVHPAAGARWAERLWFTLPAVGSWRDAPLPPGQDFGIRVYERRVVGQSWGTGEPVYLVHGWGGRSTQLAAFVQPLLDVGFRVVAYDAPSHGRSEPGPSGVGSSTSVEFADTLQAVIEAFGPPAGVVAHSLGCMAVASVLRTGGQAERLVFVAPMADAYSYTDDFTRMLGGGSRIRTRLTRRIEERVGLPMSHFDIAGTAEVTDTPPLLVFHDNNDKETRLSGAQDIVAAWPDADLVTTSGLGHHRILRDPHVVAGTVEFLKRSPLRADRAATQLTWARVG